MRALKPSAALLASLALASALFLPDVRLAEPALLSRHDAALIARDNEFVYVQLEKRRGGGGGGGGGRGGGSSGGGSRGGSSGGSSGSSRGSSGSSSGSSSSSSSSGSSGSRAGITSSSPIYGGGRYYSGGSTTAYSSGLHSPSGIAPYLVGGAALGFFGGSFLHGAYAYPYTHPYIYHNASAPASRQNESLPVECLCAPYNPCGCDDSGNTTYLNGLLSGPNANASVARIATVNGTQTVVVDGTLPNGTDGSTSGAAGGGRAWAEGSGYWVMVAVVAGTVWGL